jgi:hypothetical protein
VVSGTYVHSPPVLVCTDEDREFRTKVRESDNYDFDVHLTVSEIGGREPLVAVVVPAHVWREWMRAVEQTIREEYKSRKEDL